MAQMIRRLEVALVTTVDHDGRFHTRPLQTLGIESDRTLWFFTDARSGKAAELLHDARLSLGYGDPRGGRYLAIAGTGRVLRDPKRARSLWTLQQRAYYPRGPEDERLALLCVRVERAESWLAPGRTAHLVAALRARVTGRPATIVGRNFKLP
ncbi:MAG: pyridoxamine 5'-phosphate oxidase family protein [Gammaproteobacteria bacterium]|nr:pyridoxamine 5'-phosphate oxidase family protein [Gammaproteobacteria bacterium]MBV8403488.1 pyridoxamine 5'-phosphate oxidase family protein [Gammaproteobacteria bacterium]